MQEPCPGIGTIPKPLRMCFEAGEFDFPRIKENGQWRALTNAEHGSAAGMCARLKEVELEVAC